MTDTTAPNIKAKVERLRPGLGLIKGLPLWVRVCAIVTVVLIAIFLSSMVLGASGAGVSGGHGSDGSHGSGGQMQMTDRNTSGMNHGSGSNHGSGNTNSSRGHSSDGPHGTPSPR